MRSDARGLPRFAGHLGLLATTGVLVWARGASAWVLPALLGQPCLRAYLLAEHTGCPFVPEMWRNTRTTPTIAPVHWLTWNMLYHAGHHAYPAVPFHRLPEAHRRMRAGLAHVTPGYLAAQRDILDGLPHRVPATRKP